MSEELEKSGIYIDEFCLIRVLQPEIANETNELRNECLKFNEKLSEFKNIADVFINLADNYAKEVEVVKLKALSTLNTVNTMFKKREHEQQKIQSQIIELMIVLDRLKIDYQFLAKVEAEQAEILENFHAH